MASYLLNTTIIWLVSLVVFDVFLRRETFHGYNRIYLLVTFIMGLALPLVSWPQAKLPHSSNIIYSVASINKAKQHLVAYTTPATTAASRFTTVHVIWTLYIIGIGVCIVLLLHEIIKLLHLYQSGYKWKEGKWTIVITNKPHSPFSLLRMIFVEDRARYSNEEWQTILLHEQAHTTLLHFTDVLLLQLARIVFWFHPLVYAYNRRLLMIHEYQADRAAGKDQIGYGHFLIDQALLQRAPNITHTLNRSPIKKRIIMLSHRSVRARHAAKLLVMPITLLFLVFCTKTIYSQTKHFDKKKPNHNKDIITYKGVPPDTDIVHDPVTNKNIIKVTYHDSIPANINNQPIYTATDLQEQPCFPTDGGFYNYVVKHLKEDICKLPDGTYQLKMHNIVVKGDGNFASANFGGIINTDVSKQHHSKPINSATNVIEIYPSADSESEKQGGINVDLLMDLADVVDKAPLFIPAQKNGKAVAAIYTSPQFDNNIRVKNHQILEY